jgi:hypothetical protein
MTIKETKDYSVQVGNLKDKTGFSYQIINKKYGVIEIETQILPQALKHIDDLQEALDLFLVSPNCTLKA